MHFVRGDTQDLAEGCSNSSCKFEDKSQSLCPSTLRSSTTNTSPRC